MARAVEQAAIHQGLTVTCLRSATGFVELQIADDTEVCRVDLAYDARIRPPERTPITTVLALEELAADKVLALFARAQARDFIDVAALADRFGWPRLYELAAEKDTRSARRGSRNGCSPVDVLSQQLPVGLVVAGVG
ncbi:MAG: nucleotidyl transferase AbiEii/AbiGii toxin family protein [Egibacteraceae bacterium]